MKKRVWQTGSGLIFFILAAVCAHAQDPATPGPTATTPNQNQADQRAAAAIPITQAQRSPKATLFHFLESIHQARHDDPSAWEQVFGCFDTQFPSHQRAKDTARQLWGVLNRLERVDDTTPIPDDQAVRDHGLTTYTYFPHRRFDPALLKQTRGAGSITLVKLDSGAWKFSAPTVEAIHRLYTRLEHRRVLEDLVDERVDSFALWLRSKMPGSLKRQQLLSLEYWQWLGLLALVLIGVVLDHTIRYTLRLATQRLLTRRRATASHEAITAAVRPLGMFAAGLVWLVLLHLLNLPDQALLVLLTAARLFVILAGTWAAWCITDLIGEVLMRKADQTQTKIDDVLVPLVRKTAKIFIVIFGLIYSASALSIPILPMLTSLGIGGLAFAFAAKDTIENFFGSVAVVLDRPFEVGDWVVIDDVEGTVEEVGFRSTRVRTFYNSEITVPNATLVRATVDNYGRRRYRRVKTHIGIQYDTPPDKIVAFTEGIRELIRTHPYTRKDYFQVWLHEFAGSSLNILLYVFHETPDWATELRERERLFLDIIRLADQLGVQFAFPTQTIHLYNEDPNAPHHPAQAPSATADQHAMTQGIQLAQRITQAQPWHHAKPGPVEFSQGPTRLDNDDSAIEDRTAGS